MESLGNKLKTAREDKGYQYDQISGETNIAVRYLEALEREDFSGFPGEAYLLGFLKNYGEYLGLDPAELLRLYNAMKIQEQPVPVEQLLHSPSPLPKILLGVFIALAVISSAGGLFHFIRSRPRPDNSAIPAVRAPVEYVMNTESLERRFYQGDSILIPTGRDQYKLELSRLGEAVTIVTPQGTVILDLSQEVMVDLNRDGISELRITAADFAKNDPSAGALLRFDLDNTLPPLEGGSASGAAAADASGGEDAVPILSQSASGMANAVTIFSSPNPYPFTMQAAFQGYCMFRWEILSERDRRDRNERYFQRSEEQSIQAQNGIRLWISNAQAAKVQIIGGGRTVPLEIGLAGEVVVAEIRWVRDDENRYRLVLVRLE